MKISHLKGYLLSLSLFTFCATANSQSNILIEGFAQWQADRVERIALDQAVFGMMENEYVKTFFPQTIVAVDSYGGGTSAQRLIPLIQTTIKHDIEDIETTFNSCIKTYINEVKLGLESNDANKISAALQNLKDFNYELDSVNVNNASDLYKSLPDLYKKFQSWVCLSTDDTQKLAISKQEISLITSPQKLPPTITKSAVNQESEAALLSFPRFKSTSSQDPFDEAISLVNSMLLIINQYEEYRASSSSSKNSVIAIHFFVRFFELFGSNDQNYTQFKSLGLFLASLIEAKEPSDVAAVLDTFIDDQEAYRNKRLDANTALYSWFTLPAYDANTESISSKKTYKGYCLVIGCQNTLFLGSYFGASIVNLPDEDTLENEIQIRAFGPVGLEYKILSVYGSPITINLAPLDIGNYISNELQDMDYTARFSDIVAPSIFLSYSMEDRPFSFLVGYQKDAKVGNNIEENTFFVSFAFDLPIFTIY